MSGLNFKKTKIDYINKEFSILKIQNLCRIIGPRLP